MTRIRADFAVEVDRIYPRVFAPSAVKILYDDRGTLANRGFRRFAGSPEIPAKHEPLRTKCTIFHIFFGPTQVFGRNRKTRLGGLVMNAGFYPIF